MRAWWLAAALAGGEPEDLEIEVLSDPFARFRDTRWRVDSRVGLPFPAVMYARLNGQLEVVAAELRLVVSCGLDGAALRRRAVVRCRIEDAALTLAARQHELPSVAAVVLAEMDAAMTGLEVELQVAADGRVLDVGVVGEVQETTRVNAQNENIRQLVTRALLGFHVSGPDRYRDDEEWFERDSRLLALPRLTWLGQGLGGDDTERLTVGPDTDGPGAEVLGSGFSRVPRGLDMAHISVGEGAVGYRVDLYQGSYVIQGAGTGVVNVGSDVQAVFTGPITTVGVYDPVRGFVTERRWTVSLAPTASSALAAAGSGFPYWQLGSLAMLGRDEASDVGPSEVVPRPR